MLDVGMISRRYARALLMFAKKYGQEHTVFTETARLSQSYVQYPALKRILSNLMLTAQEKEHIITVCAGGEVSKEFRRFIQLLVARNREEFLQNICLTYQDMYRTEARLLEVELSTAAPIREEDKNLIAAKIAERTGTTVHIHSRLNPDLIGGYQVRWGSYRVDASVLSKLERIKERIKEDISHG